MAGGAKRWIETGKGSSKVSDLQTYVDNLKAKLISTPPAKHVVDPTSYKQFLQREIELHQNKLDRLKIDAPTKG